MVKFWPFGFLFIWPFGHKFGLPVFYLFGPLDSALWPSKFNCESLKHCFAERQSEKSMYILLQSPFNAISCNDIIVCFVHCHFELSIQIDLFGVNEINFMGAEIKLGLDPIKVARA